MALALALATGTVAAPGATAQAPSAGTPTRDDIVNMMLNVPGAGETFGALKADYPDEFARVTDLMTEAMTSPTGGREAAMRAFAEMQHFTSSKVPAVAAAPGEDLQGLASATELVVRQLQMDDPGMCARFSFATFAFSDVPSPAAQLALSHLMALQLHASRHAEQTPRAPRSGADPAAAAAHREAIARIDPAAAALLRDPARLQAATDREKCAAGVAIYTAAAALPREQSADVMAGLIIQFDHRRR